MILNLPKSVAALRPWPQAWGVESLNLSLLCWNITMSAMPRDVASALVLGSTFEKR